MLRNVEMKVVARPRCVDDARTLGQSSESRFTRGARSLSHRRSCDRMRGKREEENMHNTFRMAALVLALAVGPLAAIAPTDAQTQGSERREDRRDDRKDARDTRQTGRENARDAKAACKAGDEKTRAECRKEKRDVKQDARESARDIKKQ
jgi:hypothetical protein